MMLDKIDLMIMMIPNKWDYFLTDLINTKIEHEELQQIRILENLRVILWMEDNGNECIYYL